MDGKGRADSGGEEESESVIRSGVRDECTPRRYTAIFGVVDRMRNQHELRTRRPQARQAEGERGGRFGVVWKWKRDRYVSCHCWTG